ncbi:Tim17/Tim22/Tim23/Pmp24 family-domain-containing protein [Kalaharituber pfeilii]|nr:Tim17/Tim22/Tim23/Pmp24 family-domain-containing protein [Kalaharituber pfeilii]
MDPIKQAITAFIVDPKNHDFLAILKGLRNGLVYGAKIRFPHALVMTVLFRDGTFREKLTSILSATRQHAFNLASFVTIYKSTMYLLTRLHKQDFPPLLPTASPGTVSSKLSTSTPNEPAYYSLLAGLLGGYLVFGRSTDSAAHAVNQQIVLYVFARVAMALAKLAVAPPKGAGTTSAAVEVLPGVGSVSPNGGMGAHISKVGWPVFASMSWGLVMYLFRWHPETIQPSLRSSMTYLYVDSDTWNSFKNFLVYNR